MRLERGLTMSLVVFAILQVAAFAEVRAWTGHNGKVINAELVGVSRDGTKVALRLPTGDVVEPSVANLSAADQAYIAKRRVEIEQQQAAAGDTPPAALDYGDINPEYLPPSPWPVVTYQDPGGWTTIDVTEHGLKPYEGRRPPPNADVDAAEAIRKILAETQGRRRLHFPAGSYVLKSSLFIREGDIWLDGDGKRTKFFLDFPAGKEYNGILFKGDGDKSVPLDGIPKRGDSSVKLVAECTAHDYWTKKGYNGYGVTIERSSGVNVINNRAYNLRHHYELSWGTSYSVVAYNVAEPTYEYCDVGSHHGDLGYCNLFEGNKCRDASFDWGESSWNAYNFFYRNQASRRVGSFRPKRSVRPYMVVIGNETSAIGTEKARNPYVGANIVKGELQWRDVPEGSHLPPSLFLHAKPDYLEGKEWPLFGPPVGD